MRPSNCRNGDACPLPTGLDLISPPGVILCNFTIISTSTARHVALRSSSSIVLFLSTRFFASRASRTSSGSGIVNFLSRKCSNLALSARSTPFSVYQSSLDSNPIRSVLSQRRVPSSSSAPQYILGLASPPSNLPTNSCMGVYAFLS